MLGAWKDHGRVASLVTTVHLLHVQSLCTDHSLSAPPLPEYSAGATPPCDVTGDRRCVAPGGTSVPLRAPRFP